MKRRSREGRFAERTVVGLDDRGAEERIVFWIERRAGAVWVVGRSVNPELEPNGSPRGEDVVFESFELEEALAHANEALEDDVTVLEGEGRETDVRPFTRRDVIPVLERWFFNR